jgi:hypothetical protein
VRRRRRARDPVAIGVFSVRQGFSQQLARSGCSPWVRCRASVPAWMSGGEQAGDLEATGVDRWHRPHPGTGSRRGDRGGSIERNRGSDRARDDRAEGIRRHGTIRARLEGVPFAGHAGADPCRPGWGRFRPRNRQRRSLYPGTWHRVPRKHRQQLGSSQGPSTQGEQCRNRVTKLIRQPSLSVSALYDCRVAWPAKGR